MKEQINTCRTYGKCVKQHVKCVNTNKKKLLLWIMWFTCYEAQRQLSLSEKPFRRLCGASRLGFKPDAVYSCSQVLDTVGLWLITRARGHAPESWHSPVSTPGSSVLMMKCCCGNSFVVSSPSQWQMSLVRLSWLVGKRRAWSFVQFCWALKGALCLHSPYWLHFIGSICCALGRCD